MKVRYQSGTAKVDQMRAVLTASRDKSFVIVLTNSCIL